MAVETRELSGPILRSDFVCGHIEGSRICRGGVRGVL